MQKERRDVRLSFALLSLDVRCLIMDTVWIFTCLSLTSSARLSYPRGLQASLRDFWIPIQKYYCHPDAQSKTMSEHNRRDSFEAEWLPYVVNIGLFIISVIVLSVIYTFGPALLRRFIRSLIVAPRLDRIHRQNHLEEDFVSEDEQEAQAWTDSRMVDAIELSELRLTD